MGGRTVGSSPHRADPLAYVVGHLLADLEAEHQCVREPRGQRHEQPAEAAAHVQEAHARAGAAAERRRHRLRGVGDGSVRRIQPQDLLAPLALLHARGANRQQLAPSGLEGRGEVHRPVHVVGGDGVGVHEVREGVAVGALPEVRLLRLLDLGIDDTHCQRAVRRRVRRGLRRRRLHRRRLSRSSSALRCRSACVVHVHGEG
mmetsp:Transcript_48106/g.139359  ORF Transcript_48106/g.139359 Transcript_48106/m.139359 type:complete len:202 (+) Transcript_48106:421-1026(+)